MKKLIFGLMAFVAMAFAGSAQAQELEMAKTKPNVFIDYFSRPSSVPFQYGETVRNEVMKALQNSGRINLIDVDTKDILKIEQSRREEGASAGDNIDRLAVMNDEGADLLLQGVIDGITITETETKDSKGKVTKTYSPVYAFTLKVVNPKDGKIIHTEAIKAPNGIFDLSGFTVLAYSPEEAVTAYSKIIPGKLKKFIKVAFPIVGTIVDFGEEKKGEVKTLYTNLGSDNGAAKGQKYEVREVRKVAGRESRKVIGEIEITDVEGDDLSAAKVTKGGKEIYTSKEGGNRLIVTSKD